MPGGLRAAFFYPALAITRLVGWSTTPAAALGSIAMHEPVNSRHSRRDAEHDQSEAAALLP